MPMTLRLGKFIHFCVQEVAERVGTSLSVLPPLEQQYDLSGGQQLQMRLGGQHQLQNASLAVALAAGWEAAAGAGPAAAERQQQLASGVLPAVYAEGIQTCEWPGRSQVLQQKFVPSQWAASCLARRCAVS